MNITGDKLLVNGKPIVGASFITNEKIIEITSLSSNLTAQIKIKIDQGQNKSRSVFRAIVKPDETSCVKFEEVENPIPPYTYEPTERPNSHPTFPVWLIICIVVTVAIVAAIIIGVFIIKRRQSWKDKLGKESLIKEETKVEEPYTQCSVDDNDPENPYFNI